MKIFLAAFFAVIFSMVRTITIKLSAQEDWVPERSDVHQIPTLSGLRYLGINKQNEDLLRAEGVYLRPLHLVTASSGSEFCDQLAITFSDFDSLCGILPSNKCFIPANETARKTVAATELVKGYRDLLIQQMEEIDDTTSKVKNLFLNASPVSGRSPRSVSFRFKRSYDEVSTKRFRRIKRFGLDIVALGLAGTAQATALAGLGISIDNKGKISKLKSLVRKIQEAANKHDDEIIENRAKIIQLKQNIGDLEELVNHNFKLVNRTLQLLHTESYLRVLHVALSERLQDIKGDLKRLHYFGEIPPALISAAFVKKRLHHQIPQVKKTGSVYDLQPALLYQLGTAKVVAVWPQTTTMVVSYCLPLLLHKSLSVRYEITPVGTLSKNKEVFSIPTLPRYVAFPLKSKCLQDAVFHNFNLCDQPKAFIQRCPPITRDTTIIPDCALPPSSSKCKFRVTRIPSVEENEWLHATYVEAGFVITTNTKRWRLNDGLSGTEPAASKMVKRIQDVYQIPFSGYAVFGHEQVVHGKPLLKNQNVSIPEWEFNFSDEMAKEIEENISRTAVAFDNFDKEFKAQVIEPLDEHKVYDSDAQNGSGIDSKVGIALASVAICLAIVLILVLWCGRRYKFK